MIGIAVFLGGAIHLLVYYTYVGFVIKNIMINNRQLVIYAVVAYLCSSYWYEAKRSSIEKCRYM